VHAVLVPPERGPCRSGEGQKENCGPPVLNCYYLRVRWVKGCVDAPGPCECGTDLPFETEGVGRQTSHQLVLAAGSVESPMGWDIKGIRNQSSICMSVNKASIWELEDLRF